mmetsp:Transcript_38529/g.77676  ORF Transcript_38529/g.77676 Transcript_38529/m.77676 type:complete len:306 (-) Transcript_38529:695-1612(-)
MSATSFPPSPDHSVLSERPGVELTTLAVTVTNPSAAEYFLLASWSKEMAGGAPATTSTMQDVEEARESLAASNAKVYVPTGSEFAPKVTDELAGKAAPLQFAPVPASASQLHAYANAVADSSGSSERLPSRVNSLSAPTCRNAPPAMRATNGSDPTSTVTVAELFKAGLSVMNPTTRNVYVVRAAKSPAEILRARGFFEVSVRAPANWPESSSQVKLIFALDRSSDTQVIAGSSAVAWSLSLELCEAVVTGFAPWILITGAGAPSLVMTTLVSSENPKKFVTVKEKRYEAPAFNAAGGITTWRNP